LAAECRAANLLLSAGASYRSISPIHRALSSKPTGSLLLPIDGTDSLGTDGHTDGCSSTKKPCSRHYAGNVNKFGNGQKKPDV